MIERLLAAERALADGQLDRAEGLFRQVAEADERNAIAVVGLAEVALARGDRRGAAELARRALTIDPDDAAAARLAATAHEDGVAPPVPSAEAPELAPAAVVARASLGTRIRAWFARLVGRDG